ncbi:MAG: 3',5'-cyclic-nucleotide phosphodiesterase [Syntrophobacteraceae bacterium]|jgi:ribonuclease BN (tRNA processing enzyme)|nr:3',5'-cyclic-nucleotide phosphodiesterase [Syntrophobacteraceae bacterium]
MKIRVLGASGSETPGHRSPAFLLNDTILFDAGTVGEAMDAHAQAAITHVFLTHAHLDHIKAIPFLVDNMVSTRPEYQLTVVSGIEVLHDLRCNIFNDRIWPDFTLLPNSDTPVLRYQEIKDGETVQVRGYSITATPVHHAVPAYGYLVSNATQDAFIYTGDTGPTDSIWKRTEGHRVRLLIVEVSFPNELEHLALASGHLTPTLLAGEMAKMPVIPEKIYITHLKPVHRDAIASQLQALKAFSVTILEDENELII